MNISLAAMLVSCLCDRPTFMEPAPLVAQPNDPHKKQHGTSGKATQWTAQCCSCKVTLNSRDALCRNRSCELFMAEADAVQRFTYQKEWRRRWMR